MQHSLHDPNNINLGEMPNSLVVSAAIFNTSGSHPSDSHIATTGKSNSSAPKPLSKHRVSIEEIEHEVKRRELRPQPV
jgi:hypothetical protein